VPICSVFLKVEYENAGISLVGLEVDLRREVEREFVGMVRSDGDLL